MLFAQLRDPSLFKELNMRRTCVAWTAVAVVLGGLGLLALPQMSSRSAGPRSLGKGEMARLFSEVSDTICVVNPFCRLIYNGICDGRTPCEGKADLKTNVSDEICDYSGHYPGYTCIQNTYGNVCLISYTCGLQLGTCKNAPYPDSYWAPDSCIDNHPGN
jgi:hypothetical protein